MSLLYECINPATKASLMEFFIEITFLYVGFQNTSHDLTSSLIVSLHSGS